MLFLYNLGIRVYYIAILVASLFNKKARLWIRGRKRIFEQIRSEIDPAASIIWFHCSSLGEFEQGRPVIEKIRETYPGKKILLTFYSPSGYEIRKNYPGADYVFYLPLDTKKNAVRFTNLVKPEIAFFVKYEYWFHFLSQLKQKNIKIHLISGIFRSGQVFFKWYGKWFRKILRTFNHLFVQDNESARLLHTIGFDNVTVCGDTRFDRVYAIAQKTTGFSLIPSFINRDMVLIAGSTWPPDEEIIARFINECKLPVKYIIAPHEIHEHGIAQLQKWIHRKTVRYTSMTESDLKEADVLIIDTIGILSSLYQYGSVAYIGGGFGKGIHNILEAATFGLPVIFGPNYNKFREANELVGLKGAFSIKDLNDLNQVINNFISNHQAFKTAGEKAREYVQNNLGATDIITKFVRSSL